MKLEIEFNEDVPNEVHLYSFVTMFAAQSGFTISKIMLSALQHYAWFVRNINAGRKFYIEEVDENGKRRLAPVVFKDK